MTPKTDSMYRGDVRSMTFTIVNPDGTAADLTGKRLIFTARTKRGTSTYAFQKTTSSGITVSDPTSGIAVMAILAADTSSYDRSVTLAYALTVDDNPGNQETVATGNLNIEVP